MCAEHRFMYIFPTILRVLSILCPLLLILNGSGCSKKGTETPIDLKSNTEIAALFPESHRPADLAWASPKVCAECHEGAHDDWLKSHHAIANRLIDPAMDAEAFAVGQVTDEAGFVYDLKTVGDAFKIIQRDVPESMPEGHDSPVIGAIGEVPLRQYLVPTSKGRLQTQALTWDPNNKEWFNVFGDEDRRPTEWGHWSQPLHALPYPSDIAHNSPSA